MSRNSRFENSEKDRLIDRKQARRHKESLRDWEKSDLDHKMDKAGQKKLNKKRKK